MYCKRIFRWLGNIKFKIEEEEGFDSPGYAEDFMAIAFLDENDELQLLTVLFEYY